DHCVTAVQTCALPIFDYESSKKFLILPARMSSLVQRHANHFISRSRRPVPRAMLGCENISLIFSSELLALIEGHLQRRVMWLQYHIWGYDLFFQLGMASGKARILMAAHVPP